MTFPQNPIIYMETCRDGWGILSGNTLTRAHYAWFIIRVLFAGARIRKSVHSSYGRPHLLSYYECSALSLTSTRIYS